MTVESLYQEIELEMLFNIGDIINEGLDFSGDYLHWQVEQLQKLGKLQDRQIKLLAKYTGLTHKQMKEYIEQVGVSELNKLDRELQGMVNEGIPYVPPGNTVLSRLEALESQATDTLNMVNSNMLKGSEQIYTDIITKASAEMLVGNKTLYQSVRDTSKAWANTGVPALIDKSGRRWSTEAYINMIVRNTQKNVANEMQEQRFDDYEMDIVEISQHSDSRPDHVPYQGKQYSRSGTSKQYPPLSETSYGAIDGIVTGIGCRHRKYGVHPKLGRPIKEDYDSEEIEENYIESQKQRYLEREIRKAKKEKVMLEAIGATDEDMREANSKIRKKQANMRLFIDSSGRTRRRTREQIH